MARAPALFNYFISFLKSCSFPLQSSPTFCLFLSKDIPPNALQAIFLKRRYKHGFLGFVTAPHEKLLWTRLPVKVFKGHLPFLFLGALSGIGHCQLWPSWKCLLLCVHAFWMHWTLCFSDHSPCFFSDYRSVLFYHRVSPWAYTLLMLGFLILLKEHPHSWCQQYLDTSDSLSISNPFAFLTPRPAQ